MGTEGDTLGKRILALIVDAILLGIVFFVLFALLGGALFGSIAGGGPPGPGAAGAMAGGVVLIQGLSFVLFMGYYVVLEGMMGQTLGKKLLGIVVVKEDGSECDFVASLIRNLLRIVDGFFLYLVGLIVILLTDRNQRIGDLAGSTVVVETN